MTNFPDETLNNNINRKRFVNSSVTFGDTITTEKVKKASEKVNNADNEFVLYEETLKRQMNKSERSGTDSTNVLTPVQSNLYTSFWKKNKKSTIRPKNAVNLKNSFDKLVAGLSDKKTIQKKSLKRPFSSVSTLQERSASFILTQPTPTSEVPRPPLRTHKKFPILSNTSQSDSTSMRYFIRGKVLSIQPKETKLHITMRSMLGHEHLDVSVFLEGIWVDTNVACKDILHIVWSKPRTSDSSTELLEGIHKEIIVSDNENYVIVNPEIFISPTRITEGIKCLRKSYLSNFNSQFAPKKSTSLGRLRHTLVEMIFTQFYDCSSSFLSNLSQTKEAILSNLFYDTDVLLLLFAVDVNLEEIYKKFSSVFDEIILWLKRFASTKFATMQVNGDHPIRASFKQLVSVEEKIWSNMWGIKGQIDMICSTELIANKKLLLSFPSALELKTGYKIVMENHAQVILYKLLIKDRYHSYFDILKNDVFGEQFCGTLLHLRDKMDALGVCVKQQQELAWLIHTRNQIAKFSVQPSIAPTISGNKRGECDSCYQRYACSIRFALKEHDYSFEKSIKYLAHKETKISKDLFQNIESESRAYFQKYMTAIDEEETHAQEIARASKAIEFSSFLTSFLPTTHGSFLYTFQLSQCDDKEVMEQSFRYGSYLIVGYPGHRRLFSGTIITKRVVSGQVLITIKSTADISLSCEVEKWHQMLQNPLPVWTLMQQHFLHSSFKKMRGNLYELMANNKHATKLRRRILGLETPQIDSSFTLTAFLAAISKRHKTEFLNLTTHQKVATQRILATDNFTCVQGLPGCGKTTVLSLAIRILSSKKKKILITSYTHNAVDNLMQKIQVAEPSLSILRLASRRATKMSLQLKLATDPAMKVKTSKDFISGLKSLIEQDQLIVGVTALSIDHVLLNRISFDYCFVDEASQINQPIVLGPLLLADKFILVGDHNQLPPLTRSKNASELSTSLLKHLFTLNPNFPILRQQFRMSKSLLEMNNFIFRHHFSDEKYFDASYFLKNVKLCLPYYSASKLNRVQVLLRSSLNPEIPISFIEVNDVASSVSTSLEVYEHFCHSGLSEKDIS